LTGSAAPFITAVIAVRSALCDSTAASELSWWARVRSRVASATVWAPAAAGWAAVIPAGAAVIPVGAAIGPAAGRAIAVGRGPAMTGAPRAAAEVAPELARWFHAPVVSVAAPSSVERRRPSPRDAA